MYIKKIILGLIINVIGRACTIDEREKKVKMVSPIITMESQLRSWNLKLRQF